LISNEDDGRIFSDHQLRRSLYNAVEDRDLPNVKEFIVGRIYEDITKTVGNTPLVKLNCITRGAEATVAAKREALSTRIL
jgi:hypothetical protein